MTAPANNRSAQSSPNHDEDPLCPWSESEFEKMLVASLGFARLNRDIRENITPRLEIREYEQLASDVEAALQESDYASAVDGLIQGAVHYSHSGYLNQQLNFPLASSSVGALWASLLNQGQAVFSMSPITSVIEKRMIEWAKQRLQLDAQSFGLSTGGGSLANLSAMLAARNRLDKWKSWNDGGESNIRVIVSRHAHYSMARSAAILGIGESNIRSVATDNKGRMDLSKVATILEEGKPTIVCLTAGTTSTGSFDDVTGFFSLYPNLDRERTWVHIDATHGGSFYANSALANHFKAFAQADSVCWDLHKVFFQSVPLSFLFFRDRDTSGYASRHSTPYLTQELQGEYPDMHNWTLECSRTANALKLWMSLNTVGEKKIVNSIDRLWNMTLVLYESLKAIPRLNLYTKPSTNILCFRVEANNEDAGQHLTHELFKRLNNSGYWSIGHVYLNDTFYIKICCMNPRLTCEHVADFVSDVERTLSTIVAVCIVSSDLDASSQELCEAVW